MFCQKCGQKLPKGTKACKECGFESLNAKLRQKDIFKISLTRGQVPINGFPTDCVVCESCMNFCSHAHEGSAVPALSRIVIDPTEYEWMMHEKKLSTVKRTVCQQCPGVAPCMAACNVPGAMYRDKKTGAVIIEDDTCTNCRACENVCPYEAVWFVEAMDKMIKCDLCGGKPECVEICPVGVLQYEKIR